ncbi:MAG TPA: cytochrome C oxidase subunit IV family protein [Candidatus Polarisedimenticolaceae bacterium]|nr:cytochrome C oxidase subunit IV family protein [Candidatus Polarisedimenticolaceae bacterium]
MSDAHSPEDLKKHVKAYILVFMSLMVLTVVTVGVYYVHLPVPAAIGVALLIATVKGSLVACYFMHLISEKKLILWVMALTIAFFAVLLLVPTFTAVDKIGP